jgi:hypothetical protein
MGHYRQGAHSESKALAKTRDASGRDLEVGKVENTLSYCDKKSCSWFLLLVWEVRSWSKSVYVLQSGA